MTVVKYYGIELSYVDMTGALQCDTRIPRVEK